MAVDYSTLTDEELDTIIGGGSISGVNAPEKPVTALDVDEQTGAGFFERMAASFKSSPESAANFFRSRYGQDNVRVRNDEVEFINPGTKKWTRADPRRLEMGDLADMAGEMPELVLGALGAIIGGTGGSVVPGA